jgi:hypothetical protein
MMIIVLMGNPRMGNVPLHFIPEMASFYCMGLWQYSVKSSFKHVLFIYFFTVCLAPIGIGISFCSLMYFISLPVIGLLSFPLLLAFMICKSDDIK